MRRTDREQGFTVVELMIGLALSSVVMVALAGLLISQTGVERRMRIVSDNQEELRQAVLAIQRDLRSSEPLVPLATSSDYQLRVDLSIYAGLYAATPSTLSWKVDPATKELRREAPNGSGGVITTYRLRGVANTSSDPLFEFYKANGDTFVLGTDPPVDVANCAVRVRLSLTAAPTAGAAPTRLVSDVQLRNRRPGGTGCPQTPVVP